MLKWIPETIITMLRFIAYWIDSFIAWLVGILYNLILSIANVNFSASAIEAVGNRIYVLLAIFMLFKIAFSLITYITNPDSMFEKGAGAPKLLRNIFIVLILIVSVPFLFKQAMKLQGYILEEGVIQKIIFGASGFQSEEEREQGASGNVEAIENAGKVTAFVLYSSMIYPDVEKLQAKYPDIGIEHCLNISRESPEGMKSGCQSALNIMAPGGSGRDGLGDYYIDILDGQDVQALLNSSIIMSKYGGEYIFKYNGLISIVSGGVMIFVFISLAIAVAIRVVKLGFLQVLAPIPIMTFIDPKSGEKGMFQRWLKETLSTYAELFIRLASIFFAIYGIIILTQGGFEGVDGEDVGAFVKVVIILAILIFANQLPKLLEELIPGFKSGGFSLNPMKQINESPLARLAVGKTLGTARAVGGNVYSGIRDRRGFLKTLGSATAGAGRAAFSGRGDSVSAIASSGHQAAISGRQDRARRNKYYQDNPDERQGFFERKGSEIISSIDDWAGYEPRGEGTVKETEKNIKIKQEELEFERSEEMSARGTARGHIASLYSRYDSQTLRDLVSNASSPIKIGKKDTVAYNFGSYDDYLKQNRTTDEYEDIKLTMSQYDPVSGDQRYSVEERKTMLEKYLSENQLVTEADYNQIKGNFETIQEHNHAKINLENEIKSLEDQVKLSRKKDTKKDEK